MLSRKQSSRSESDVMMTLIEVEYNGTVDWHTPQRQSLKWYFAEIENTDQGMSKEILTLVAKPHVFYEIENTVINLAVVDLLVHYINNGLQQDRHEMSFTVLRCIHISQKTKRDWNPNDSSSQAVMTAALVKFG